MTILYKIAEPKTCWWSNDSKGFRNDTLFGLTRHYHRKSKTYIYRLTIGRFTVGVIF